MVNAANPKAGSCPCNPGGKCTCSAARKSKRSTGPEPPIDPSITVKPSTGHEYRRVLPKPKTTSPVLPGRPGPVHNPSSVCGGKPNQRLHMHTESLYSPYERAYDANHSHHTSSDRSESDVSPMEIGPSLMTRVPENFDWSVYPTIPVSSLCACGDSCSCQGCFEHRGPSAFQAYQGSPSSLTCANPRYCTSCVECAVVLGYPNQQITALSSDDTQGSSFMDEWLRQLVEAMPTLPADGDTFQRDTPVPGRSTHSPSEPSNCCNRNCRCQLGFCACAGECFGGCGGGWRPDGDAADVPIDPMNPLPSIGLSPKWDVTGDQPWILLAEPGISSDGSSDGEVMPGVNQAGDFNWGV